MATIAEAQAQVQEAKTELSQAETQAQQRQAEIRLARAESQQRLSRQTKIGTIEEQLRISTQVGRGGVSREIGRRRQAARKEFKATGRKISKAREELTTFETQLTTREKEISGIESQIKSAQAQQAEQAALEADIASARKLVRRGIFDPFAPPRVKKFVRELQAGQVTLQPTATEIELQMSLPVGFRELPSTEIVSGLPGSQIFAGQSFAIPKGFVPIQTLASGGFGVIPREQLIPLTVEPIEQKPFGRGGLTQRLQTFITETETRGFRGDIAPTRRALGGAAAFATVFTEFPGRVGGLVKGLVTEPITTVKGLPGGIVFRAREITEKIKAPTPGVGLGLLAGEALLFKGIGKAPKLAVRTTDIFRVTGLRQLPIETIIAPEFFAGQTFPKIRRGQTAGELLGEFKPILPGEIRPAGFTAAPKPFALETEALRGTSEIPGVFQAPLVSPRFLRVASEETRFFGFSPFETFRPSIIRITPEEIRLAPGVSPGQIRLAPLKETQAFFGARTRKGVFGQPVRVTGEFEPRAERGVSFVPFIKTEKEAVIPFGTPLKITQQRFFVKFEGRRIPIFEFEAGRAIGTEARLLPTIEEVSRSVSGRRIGGRARVTPLELGLSSRFFERAGSRGFITSSRARQELTSFRILPTRRREPTSSFFITPPPSRITPPPPSRIGVPSIGETPGLLPFDIVFEDPFKEARRVRRRTAERKLPKRKTKRRAGFDFRLAPSFTAIVGDLRGVFPKELKIGGISPREIRVLPRRKK